jgi:hypothetical protein
MTYYTIKLDDAIQLTGNIVPIQPIKSVKAPPNIGPLPLNESEEYSCFEMSGDLIVEGNIIGNGSLTSIISSLSAPPKEGESNIKGKIIYSNDFLYLCIDDIGTWIRWPVSTI